MSMQRAVVLGWVVACGMSVATAAELGPDSSVTIVPVIMAGDPSKDVADVVGVMLEQEGMPNIRTVEQEFVPAAGASLEQVAESFGTHASAQSLKTDCALFAEFVGTPKTGVAEIRAVLVDSAGKVLWNDCQKPGDADFDRVRPQNPMTCCVLLRDRLKPVFKLTDATRSQAKEGRMAKLWAEKSGTPSDQERAAIGERLETLKKAGAAAAVLVYPVQLSKETDAASAEHIVKLLNEAELCQAQAAKADIQFDVAPNSNEQRRLWDLAKAVQKHVRDNPPTTDYVLCAEYTIRPHDQQVWSVHTIVCDRAGEWVIVDFQNNHQDDFQSVNPQTRDDCGALVLRRLRAHLK